MPTTPAGARRLGIWASALTVVSIILFGRTEISFLHSYFDIRVLKVICEIASLAPIYAAFRCITLYAGGVKICERFTLFAATYGVIFVLYVFAGVMFTMFMGNIEADVGEFVAYLSYLAYLVLDFNSWALCIPAIFLVLGTFDIIKNTNKLFWGYCAFVTLNAATTLLRATNLNSFGDGLDYSIFYAATMSNASAMCF